jgi:transposase-like protein
MTGQKGMRHYPRETKLEAIRLYIEEGKRQADIAKQLGIQDTTRIKIWLRKYRKEGEKAFDRKPRTGLIRNIGSLNDTEEPTQ